MDVDLVIACEDAIADINRRNDEPLGWADMVRLHPLNGGGVVGEERVASPALPSLVKPEERLVDYNSF